MTSQSARGRRERVAASRKQARAALGHDGAPDLFDTRPKTRFAEPYVASQAPIPPTPSEGIGVLTLGEASARLGLSRQELETMIAAGKIEALPTGFTRTVPTREVDRVLARKE